MKNDNTVYLGPDVREDSIVTAYPIGLGKLQSPGNIKIPQRDPDRPCARMQSKAPHVRFVDEAGRCGCGLHRHLTKKRFDCVVCAPSRIARTPDDRVKTDRRDASRRVKAPREAAPHRRSYPVVEATQALHGVQFTVAIELLAEIGDPSRFDHPRKLMAWLGMTPSEYSSGGGAKTVPIRPDRRSETAAGSTTDPSRRIGR